MKHKQKIRLPLFLLALVLILFWAFSERLQIVTYTVTTPKVASAIRLVLLTDLHSCYYGEKQEQLAKTLARLQPDAICLGGDIFDDETSHAGTIALLDAVAHLYPCYFVTGNHEHWSDEVHVLTSLMRSYGVTVLEGETTALTVGEDVISISGIDDPTGFLDGEEWTTQIQTVQKNAAASSQYTVLLSHRPERTVYYEDSAFDLVLTGHAHGGQIRIPLLMNGLFAPNQGYFPKYAGGMYSLGKTTMIVSRGLCKNDLPRIWNRPEVVVIDIVPEEA